MQMQRPQLLSFFENRAWYSAVLISFIPLFPPSSMAQVSEEDEEIFELSPFTVDASDDEGYRATQTMAGTRISTSLKNVAAQVDVMTAEFLTDVAAVTLDDAMLYSLNVESSQEYVADPFGDGGGELAVEELNQSSRVRGLANASKTRNFFPTLFQIDLYNSDRFTFNSGPNAILFGLGSPGGVINQGVTQAHFKDSNEIGLRFDSENSYRTNFTMNRVLVEDKLAIRVSGLVADKKSWRKPSQDKKERIFGTLTYKPFESGNTTIRASIESIDRDANIPRNSFIQDSVTPYLAYRDAKMSELNITDPFDPRLYWAPGDPKDDTTPFTNYGNGNVLVTGAFEAIPDIYRLGNAWGNSATTRAPQNLPGVDSVDVMSHSLTDASVYPWDINLGGATLTSLNGTSASLFIDQKVNEDFYIEFGYQKEELSRTFDDWLRGSDQVLRMDVNAYLPQLDPSDPLVLNPNRGKYYSESWSRGSYNDAETENARLTASYELDLAENNRWFGKHNFAALIDRSESLRLVQNYRGSMYPADAVGGLPEGIYWNGLPTGSSFRRRVLHRVYFDDPANLSSGDSYSYDPGKHVTSLNQETFAGLNNVLVHFHPDAALEYGVWTPGNFSREKTEGSMVAVQSSFFEDKVVLTYGKRNDHYKKAIFTTGKEVNAPAPYNQRWEDYTKGGYPDLSDPDLDEKGGQETKGAVVSPLSWLSFHYNQSSNRTAGSPSRDIFTGSFVPPSSGEGEDYGVRMELLESKFFVKLNWYENSQNRVASPGFGNLRYDFQALERQLTRWSQDSEGTGARQVGFVPIDPEIYDAESSDHANNTVPLSDLVATGFEFTATYNPMPNWRFSLNASKTSSVESNIAGKYRDFIVNERLDEYRKYYDSAWEFSKYGAIAEEGEQTVEEWVEKNIFYDNLDLATLLEGRPADRVREWRANLVTNYSFREGNLRGFGIGGAVRWRSSRSIGFPLLSEDDRAVPDIDNPWSDSGITDIDAWVSYDTMLFNDTVDASFQLNIRNLFDDDSFIEDRAISTGQVVRLSPREPRVLILSSNFKF